MKMQDYIALYKALADEKRMKILLLLGKKELCVCQLMAVLGVSQPLVSRDLRVLREAGLIEPRREGKLVFYRRAADAGGPCARPMKRMLATMSRGRPAAPLFARLGRCERFQRETRRCDMASLKKFMATGR